MCKQTNPQILKSYLVNTVKFEVCEVLLIVELPNGIENAEENKLNIELSDSIMKDFKSWNLKEMYFDDPVNEEQRVTITFERCIGISQ